VLVAGGLVTAVFAFTYTNALRGLIVNIQVPGGQIPAIIETLGHGQNVTLPANTNALITCPATEPSHGSEWNKPTDFPEAGTLRVYEYSPQLTERDRTLSASARWSGKKFLAGQVSTNPVSTFAAGKTYYIRSQNSFSLSCSTAVPLAYWSLEEGNGSAANDVVGIHNGAIAGTPSWVEGPVTSSNFALNFNGATVIDAQNSDNLNFDPTDQFSFSFIIDSASASNGILRNFDFNNQYVRGYIVTMQDRKINLVLADTMFDGILATSSIILPEDRASHVIVSYDGTKVNPSDRIAIYVNDTHDPSPFVQLYGNPTTFSLPTPHVFVGASFPIFQDVGQMNGILDEVRIFDSIVTPSDFHYTFRPRSSSSRSSVSSSSSSVAVESCTPSNWSEAGLDSLPEANIERSAVASFNGNLWMIGGTAATQTTGIMGTKVLKSADGRSWQQVGTLPFRLESASVAAFNGKLWILGGRRDGYISNLVYSSTDGITWSQTGTLPINLSNASALIFNPGTGNKMYIVGGIQGDGIGAIRSKTIYASSDGISWQAQGSLPIADETFGSHTFQSGLSDASALVFNGKLWIIGGRTGVFAPVLSKKVYSSTTGTTWTEEGTNVLPTPIADHTATVYGGAMWLIGGVKDTTGTQTCGVYISADGQSWQSLGNALPQKLKNPRAIAFTPSQDTVEHIYVIGGKPDGAAQYKKTLVLPALPPLTSSSSSSVGPQSSASASSVSISVSSNASQSSASSAAYTPEDPITSCLPSQWMEAGINALPEQHVYATSVVHNGKMFLIGGNASNLPFGDKVLSSTDGITWTQVGTLPFRLYGHRALSYAGKLWVMGGITDSTQSQPYILNAGSKAVFSSSDDGATWQYVGNLPDYLNAFGAVVYHNQMWIVGGNVGQGYAELRQRSLKTFSSTNGITWTPQADLPIIDPRFPQYGGLSAFDAVVLNDRIIAIGGEKNFITTPSRDTLIYDPTTQTWSSHPDALPVAFTQHTAIIFEGTIRLLGGGSPYNTETNRNCISYTSTDGITWSPSGNNLPYPIGGGTAVNYPLNGHEAIWMIGGLSTESPELYYQYKKVLVLPSTAQTSSQASESSASSFSVSQVSSASSIATNLCGNSIIDVGVSGPLEECDDGNTQDGDGCFDNCAIMMRPYKFPSGSSSSSSSYQAGPRIYWTDQDNGTIQSMKSDILAADPGKIVLRYGNLVPTGLAMDTTARKLYWINNFTHRIERSNFDGRSVEAFQATDASYFGGDIAVDTSEGYVYWTEFKVSPRQSRIQRIRLDHTGSIETLASIANDIVGGIAIDQTNRVMYATLAYSHKIWKITRGVGAADVKILSAGELPTGLSLDLISTTKKIYWVDTNNSAIRRMNLDGTNLETIAMSSVLSKPVGLALDPQTRTMYIAYDGGLASVSMDGGIVSTYNLGIERPVDLLFFAGP
jgi:cysteine-rich repeat protein